MYAALKPCPTCSVQVLQCPLQSIVRFLQSSTNAEVRVMTCVKRVSYCDNRTVIGPQLHFNKTCCKTITRPPPNAGLQYQT
jgi:hypothetical protein